MTSVKSIVKSLLKDNNDTNYVLLNGQWLSNHDQTHITVSKLNPISIGNSLVTGIHGISIPEFGREGQPALYSAYLDECRVAIHQMLTNRTPISFVRGAYWGSWLLRKGINPLSVILAHRRSMNE